MNKLLKSLVLSGLVVSAMPTVLVAAGEANNGGFYEYFRNRYNAGKEYVNRFAEEAAWREGMRRTREKLPDFLKGDSNVDSVARAAFALSAIYLATKPFLKDDSNANVFALGLLGHLFKAFGVDNFSVRGRNIAELANKKREELNSKVQEFTSTYFGAAQEDADANA